jgi:hypothetical protein
VTIRQAKLLAAVVIVGVLAAIAVLLWYRMRF